MNPARQVKIKLDFASRINCIPNSLTTDPMIGEVDKSRRPKSTMNRRAAIQVTSESNMLQLTLTKNDATPKHYQQEGADSALEASQVKLQIYDIQKNSVVERGRRKRYEDKENKIFRSCVRIEHDEPEAEDKTFGERIKERVSVERLDDEVKKSRSIALMKGSKPKLTNYVSTSLALNLDRNLKKFGDLAEHSGKDYTTEVFAARNNTIAGVASSWNRT